MKISDININESLKYLIAGLYTLFLKFHSIKNVSALDAVFAAFVIGAIEYFLFRTFPYPYIQRLIDRCSRTMNGRNYIKGKWAEHNWNLRNDAWAIYQDIDNVLSGKTYPLWKNSITMFHIIGLISILYIPMNYIFSRLVLPNETCPDTICGFNSASVILFIFGLISIVCAFISETKMEARLYRDVLAKQGSFDGYLEQNKQQFIATIL